MADETTKSCEACGKTAAQAGIPVLNRCGKCKRAWYCSRECQVVDWKKKHKRRCAVQRVDRKNEKEYRRVEQNMNSDPEMQRALREGQEKGIYDLDFMHSAQGQLRRKGMMEWLAATMQSEQTIDECNHSDPNKAARKLVKFLKANPEKLVLQVEVFSHFAKK